jgi:hypothetical protein
MPRLSGCGIELPYTVSGQIGGREDPGRRGSAARSGEDSDPGLSDENEEAGHPESRQNGWRTPQGPNSKSLGVALRDS